MDSTFAHFLPRVRLSAWSAPPPGSSPGSVYCARRVRQTSYKHMAEDGMMDPENTKGRVHL